MTPPFFVSLLTFFLVAIVGIQGQADLDDELSKNIEDVFGQPPDEVTVQPTTGPTTLVEDDGSSCTCVPYYLCDPATNTVSSDGTIDGVGLIDIRFKPEGCQESVEVCCKQPRSPDNPIKLEVHPERTKGCGVRNVNGIDFTIQDNTGNEAEFGEFPWTVAILRVADSGAVCVGSLIHPQVVLTAAHCFFESTQKNKLDIARRPLELKLRAGEWDSQTNKERLPHQERPAARLVPHPNFNKNNLANDIGLVFTNEPFTLADNVNMVCLPPPLKNFNNAKNCFATGWGKVNFGAAGRYAVVMKKVELDVLEHGRCQNKFRTTRLGQRFKLHPSFLCAGGQEGKDTCSGDGGAPLACPTQGGRYEQAGIVSWGIGCGMPGIPGAYGSVAFLRAWVDEQMRAAGFTTESYTVA